MLIDRLPLDDCTLEEAKALYWLLAQLLARPVAQSWDGKMIYDVRDLGRPPGNGVRPDITNAEQSFHTDNSYNLCPPDYVALLCLHPAMEGGISQHRELLHGAQRDAGAPPRAARAAVRAVSLRPAARARARGRHGPAPSAVRVRRGAARPGRLSRFQVRNGHALAEVPLDAEGEAALEALDQIMKAPRVNREFFFERGQIQILDNRRLGHRRTGFRDFPEPERKRHLVRLWLRDWGRRFYNG